MYLFLQSAAANITLADVVYVIGLIVTLIGLLGGFARVITKMSVLQTTVENQGKVIVELKIDSKQMLETIHDLELKIIRMESLRK